MIIIGKSRGAPVELAEHLAADPAMRLLEVRGTAAADLPGSLADLDVYGVGTRCRQTLYHAAISPEPEGRATGRYGDGEAFRTIDELEQRLGLAGHPRVVVGPGKNGRSHYHVVWARVDPLAERPRAAHLGHNYRIHEEVARWAETTFGLEAVRGAFTGRREAHGTRRTRRGRRYLDERPVSEARHWEQQQAQRTAISIKDVTRIASSAWRRAQGNSARFHSLCAEAGLFVARGDGGRRQRAAIVLVDETGGVHGLIRRLEGVRAAEVRRVLGDVPLSPLDDAKTKAKEYAAMMHDTLAAERRRCEELEREVAGERKAREAAEQRAAMEQHGRAKADRKEADWREQAAAAARMLDQERRDRDALVERAEAAERACREAVELELLASCRELSSLQAQQEQARTIADEERRRRDDQERRRRDAEAVQLHEMKRELANIVEDLHRANEAELQAARSAQAAAERQRDVERALRLKVEAERDREQAARRVAEEQVKQLWAWVKRLKSMVSQMATKLLELYSPKSKALGPKQQEVAQVSSPVQPHPAEIKSASDLLQDLERYRKQSDRTRNDDDAR